MDEVLAEEILANCVLVVNLELDDANFRHLDSECQRLTPDWIVSWADASKRAGERKTTSQD